MKCKKCDEIISASCVELEDNTSIQDKFDSLKIHEISTKSLSLNQDLSRDEIIQILINEVIKLKKRVTDLESCQPNTICTNLDWSGVHSCIECDNNNNSFCSHLQLLINLTKELKQNINV